MPLLPRPLSGAWGGATRLIDLGNEVVEQAGVNRFGEGVAAVVGLQSLQVLLNELGARLYFPLCECLLERSCMQAKQRLALRERRLGRWDHGGSIGLA